MNENEIFGKKDSLLLLSTLLNVSMICFILFSFNPSLKRYESVIEEQDNTIVNLRNEVGQKESDYER